MVSLMELNQPDGFGLGPSGFRMISNEDFQSTASFVEKHAKGSSTMTGARSSNNWPFFNLKTLGEDF